MDTAPSVIDRESGSRVALAVRDENLRGRLLGRLLAEGMNVVVLPVQTHHYPSAHTIAIADTVIICLDLLFYLWRQSPDELAAAHERRRFVLLLPSARLLDAIPVMNLVDGIIFSDFNLEEAKDIIDLAASGHCLFPAGLLPELLEDRIRMGALEQLTDPEYAVLQELGHGRTNREMADRLNLNESTIKALVRSILAKLHMSNRTEAAVYAVRKGVIGRRRPFDEEEDED